MKTKEIKPQIEDAFRKSLYKWRTARGISKDSQLPIQQVIQFLESSDIVIRAKKSNKQGQPLLTPGIYFLQAGNELRKFVKE